MTKYLLNTFDYELFLGKRSGLPQDCMIEPTNTFIRVLEPHGVKAIFFVDTAYLYRLQNNIPQHEQCRIDYENIKNQLQDLIRKGHYLFPHIHPHWLDANYFPEQNQWELSEIKRYRFHTTNMEDRALLFKVSFDILREIIHPVKPDYKLNAYRAGGWSLQPFEDYKPFFKEYGIEFDFTVMPGLFQFSNAQYFDFTRTPEKIIYNFENDVLQETPDGSFTEVTSSVLKIPAYINSLNRVLLRMLYRLFRDRSYGRGEGQRPIIDASVKPVWINEQAIGKNNSEVASVELLSIVKLKTYLNYFDQNEYMQFVSHPKMLSKHNLTTFKKFLSIIYDKYQVETDCLKTIAHFKEEGIRATNFTNAKGTINVSVVIPCYNVEEYISECLDTIFAQEVQPVEIICVDDGSSDRTLEILERYKAMFPDKMHVLINDGNRGATYSRNRGLVMAQSEYINFFDADDLMLPHKLKHQITLLESLENKPDILVSACVKRYVNGTEKNYIYYKQNEWNALMDAVLGVTTSNLFKRTKVLEIQGWSEHLKSSQEYDLMFRMLRAEASVYFDTTIVCRNRERTSGSISKSEPKEKWRRYIDLRIRIYEYLKTSNKLSPLIEQTFVNVLFAAIRIYYYYDMPGAIELHSKYIKAVRTPSVTLAITSKYLKVYKLFGFQIAQKVSEWMNPQSKTIH